MTSRYVTYINLNVSSLQQVLLVTSSRRPELWIVPGGGVEPDEESSLTATREVLEEAGVTGELGRCLGIFEVSAFVMFVGVFELLMFKFLFVEY